ncbi:MAG: GtrA family protein [Vicinamibacterales bacterium]
MTGWRRFARFNLVSGLGIGVQLAALQALTTLGAHYLAATLLAVGAAVLHNFLWHWRWTWADRGTARGAWPRALVTFTAANGAVSFGGNLAVMAVLVGGFGAPPLPANLAAVAACGLVNYGLGDRVVFRTRTAMPPVAFVPSAAPPASPASPTSPSAPAPARVVRTVAR